MKRLLFFSGTCVLLFACHPSGNKKEVVDLKDSSASEKVFTNSLDYPLKSGFAGIVYVPDMMAVTYLDSAVLADMPKKIKENYDLVYNEAEEIKAELNGPPGEILYADNPAYIKFECFVLINHKPEKQPAKAKVRILEGQKMLLYNYYGAMKDLKYVYAEISKTLNEKNLTQCGPSREFYLTDPTADQGEPVYFTRIFMPVKDR